MRSCAKNREFEKGKKDGTASVRSILGLYCCLQTMAWACARVIWMRMWLQVFSADETDSVWRLKH